MTKKKGTPESVRVRIELKYGFFGAYKGNRRISQVSDDAIYRFFGKVPKKYQVNYTLSKRGKYTAYWSLTFSRMGLKNKIGEELDAVCFLPREWEGQTVTRKVLPWDYKEEVSK